jgi:hypothetical protein
MGNQGLRKSADRKIFCWRAVSSLETLAIRRRDEGGGAVVPFEHKLATEQFIPPHIGCSHELWEHLEMRFLYGHRSIRGLTVFKHEEITEEWLRAL